MDGQHIFPSRTSTPHFLGNLLGMGVLFHAIHPFHGNDCLCAILHIPPASPGRYGKQLTDIKLRFFTDISHELRTPLTLISSPVAEVLENEPLSPTAREYLTVVHQNTEHMLHLMNQILDFRKIQNQKMKLLVEKKDLISLLRKSMDNFKLIAKEKNMDYRLVTPVQSVYGWVDKDKFEKYSLICYPMHSNIRLPAKRLP